MTHEVKFIFSYNTAKIVPPSLQKSLLYTLNILLAMAMELISSIREEKGHNQNDPQLNSSTDEEKEYYTSIKKKNLNEEFMMNIVED